MPTLTVKIAEGGALLADDFGTSKTGHMWISIDKDGDSDANQPVSIGFTRNTNKDASTTGIV